MKIRHYISTNNLELYEIPARKMGTLMGNAITLKIGDEAGRGPVIGFGVAITGSSCYNLNKLPAEQRKAFLKRIYGTDGLNLNVGRLTIGSSDYSAEMYTYDDVPGDTALEHFSMARDEEYILPMTKEILSENPDLYLFASPWSPPGWMKTGGWIAGGEMRVQYVETYARYFIKYLKECEKLGINVRSVTPQNEPHTDTNGLYAGCKWHPEIEARFVHVLKKLLREEGMDVGIWLYDHNFSGWRRVQWMLEEDPELLKDITGVAFHYYDQCIEKIQPILDDYPDLTIHFTEAGPRLYDNYGTDHCKWGTMIGKSFNFGCRSFTGWNLMLDETGGPNVGPFFCGGFVTRNSQTNELTISGQYKAMEHYSRFVKRGANVFESGILGDGDRISAYPKVGRPVETCAFRNPDGSIIVVLVNPNEQQGVDYGRKQVQFSLNDEWYYLALLPDSISTVIIEP